MRENKLFAPFIWEPGLDQICLSDELPVWKYILKQFTDFHIYIDTNAETLVERIHSVRTET